MLVDVVKVDVKNYFGNMYFIATRVEQIVLCSRQFLVSIDAVSGQISTIITPIVVKESISCTLVMDATK